VSIKRLMVVGGGARSPIVLQIKADVMGRELYRTEISDASCLGAALQIRYAIRSIPEGCRPTELFTRR
jgi:sugar (pentulose or hexulose) kinase